jgi:hypothetical protein
VIFVEINIISEFTPSERLTAKLGFEIDKADKTWQCVSDFRISCLLGCQEFSGFSWNITNQKSFLHISRRNFPSLSIEHKRASAISLEVEDDLENRQKTTLFLLNHHHAIRNDKQICIWQQPPCLQQENGLAYLS